MKQLDYLEITIFRPPKVQSAKLIPNLASPNYRIQLLILLQIFLYNLFML